MKRRHFIKILGGTVILAAGFAKFATDSVRKIVSASYGKIRYPGGIKPLDEGKIQTEARWKG